MATCEKILIVGFSGAGKTALLKQLEQHPQSGWTDFADLDQLVLKQHGRGYKQLSELIEASGWEKFRLWERQVLEGWLKEEGTGVLALGGGTLSPILWELYSKSSRIKFCHLEVRFEVAWERLSLDSENVRPLLKQGKTELMAIYKKRNELFQQIKWRLNGEGPLAELVNNFWDGLK